MKFNDGYTLGSPFGVTRLNRRKLLQKLLAGSRNIRFRDFIRLVEAFGFTHARTTGSHRIYVHSSVPVPLNLQPLDGEAKPYQIKQFLELVEGYNLTMEDDQ